MRDLPPEPKECGERLQQVRVILKFDTARAFAKATGVNEKTYKAWENGQNNIPLWYVRRLKRLYGVTADWIYFGDPSALQHALAVELMKAAAA